MPSSVWPAISKLKFRKDKLDVFIPKQQNSKEKSDLHFPAIEGRTSRPSSGDLVKNRKVDFRENSSRFSLCCFVIYVYIFVLDKTAGFGCRHLYKKYLFLPAFWIWRQVKTLKLESHRLTIRNRSIVDAVHAGCIEAIRVCRTFQCIVHYWPTWNWNVSDGFQDPLLS